MEQEKVISRLEEKLHQVLEGNMMHAENTEKLNHLYEAGLVDADGDFIKRGGQNMRL
jgi:hypothetical protein